MSLHVDVIPNRGSPPAILLREAKRDGVKIRKTTLANLSKLPTSLVDHIRVLIKGGVAFDSLNAAFNITRSWPHGHVAVVLGLCRRLGFPDLLHRQPSRDRDLALAGIVARVLSPMSKLATARWLSDETAASSLGELLELGQVSGNDMCRMLDWLVSRQAWIERKLARRYLTNATLVLYDVTSSYVEGRCCPLAKFGYNRDGKRGKRQIVIGLLCAPNGCPIAVEVFDGNTADPSTVGVQVKKLQQRFKVDRIALVGDRGMVTTARIRQSLEPAQLDWISALKHTDLRKLSRANPDVATPALQPQSLAADAVAEISSPDYPNERLMVCFNPRLQAERQQHREALLVATEAILTRVAAIVKRPGSKLRGSEQINRRVGREANRRKVEKHFDIQVTDDALTFSRNTTKIADEARLDGVYVIRTSLPPEAINAEETVAAYKSLAHVEQAFRMLKSSGLQVRPIHVYTPDHVRGHVFLCALACHIEWHLRQQLAPLLFEEDDPEGAQAQRQNPVEPAQPSDRARRKAQSKQTEEGLKVHSLPTLFADLQTVVLNTVEFNTHPDHAFNVVTQPTQQQQRAFDLAGINPGKMFPVNRNSNSP